VHRSRHGIARTPVLAAITLAVAVAAGACSAAEQAESPPPVPAPAPAPAPLPPAPDRDELPRPGPEPDPTAPEDCDLLVRAAIVRVVSAQLEAFAADDLTAAYALTSGAFRQAYSTADFADLIRSEYPELLGNGGHRVDVCGIHDDVAFLVVGVRHAVGEDAEGGDSAELVLRYDLTLVDGDWHIDGASRLPGITLPPVPVV